MVIDKHLSFGVSVLIIEVPIVIGIEYSYTSRVIER